MCVGSYHHLHFTCCVCREALAAQKAKEDYLRRHMAGETEQARADLARLAIVRHNPHYGTSFHLRIGGFYGGGLCSF
jgi:hypothetical protein